MDVVNDKNAAALIKLKYEDGDIGAAVETGVKLLSADEIESKPIRWLMLGWLARGKLHILAGSPGTGKTTIALSLAACISAGLTFPNGQKAVPGKVVIWSGEDDPGDTLKPRLIAAGADLSQIQFVGPVIDYSEDKKANCAFPFDPARDVEKLAVALAAMDDLAMIIIDPIVSAVSGDSHKNAETRRSLAPLVELAAKKDAVLLGITHLTKGTQGREPLERVTGSLAFGAMARLVFGTVKQRQPEGEETEPQFTLARLKSNIGKDGGGFKYQFEQVETEGRITANRINWGEAVEGDPRAMIAAAEADPDDEAEGVVNFLRQYLSDGRREANDVYREGIKEGYSRDQLKRAKDKAHVKSEKDSTGPWYWQLRGSVAPPKEGKDVPF
jgi:hypothetical protein